jgi:hypothetical protein
LSITRPGGEDGRDTERQAAAEWLREYLADGLPRETTIIETEANEAGYSWRTIKRAKDLVGVKVSKIGYQGKWTWQLSSKENQAPSTNELAPFGKRGTLCENDPENAVSEPSKECQAPKEASSLDVAHYENDRPPDELLEEAAAIEEARQSDDMEEEAA